MIIEDYKRFPDIRTKLCVTYWSMNKDEIFLTCDMTPGGFEIGDDDQIEDQGCTFATIGNYTFQEVENEIIFTVSAGDFFNRRPSRAVIIKALEDNSRWCYVTHFDNAIQIDGNNPENWTPSENPKIINGEQIKMSTDEIVTLYDEDKDIYIVNPICDDEIQPISYKTTESETFTNLKYGKFLKIKKGKSYDIKSNMDIYIPKISFPDK